ncbi:YeeE/YedE family protein [Halorarum salinum]|uniref:YeeE/YedE family protein n=1 Tax=Halorarum salinum TaxID=2743089 RepID=A0A7D5LCZ1_9EURY|nr:YeeE/YedE family protein [Halobaculum salinum]QLG63690.1 YeeE/YedE family protein [Halobaculum salinum]
MPAISPTAYVVLSIGVGLAFGVLLQKSRFCFVSAFRDFIAFKDTRVLKGVLAGVLVMTSFWSLQATLGYFRGFWIPPWGLASLIGGFVFGVGMTMAGGCASGTLYRAGQGYVQFWITLLFMGVGYVVVAFSFPTLRSVYFEPLRFGEGSTLYLQLPWPPAVTGVGIAAAAVLVYALILGRRRLPDEPNGRTGVFADERAQVTPTGRSLAAMGVGLRSIGGGLRSYLRGFRTDDRDLKARLRDPWDARTAGVGLALVASVWFWVYGAWAITGSEAKWAGWILARGGLNVEGIEYWGSVLFRGEGVAVTVDMLMILSVVVGSFLAAKASGDFRLRWPKLERLPNPVVGGFLMGVGSRLAPGCNIANLFSGVALLSVHSILAGAGIVLGTYVMTHWLYREVGCAI